MPERDRELAGLGCADRVAGDAASCEWGVACVTGMMGWQDATSDFKVGKFKGRHARCMLASSLLQHLGRFEALGAPVVEAAAGAAETAAAGCETGASAFSRRLRSAPLLLLSAPLISPSRLAAARKSSTSSLY